MSEALRRPRYLPTDAEPGIRHIGFGDLRAALAEGWADFLAAPTQLFFLALIYPIIGLVLARAASGSELLPLVWPLTAGFAMLGPFAALGIYEISRRREQGMAGSWQDGFAVFRSPGLGSILVLGAMLLGLFVAWIAAARSIYAATAGAAVPGSLGDLAHFAFETPGGLTLLLVGNGVGLLFAAAALVLTVVSFPLLLDHDVGPVVAVRTSLRAVLANPVPMAAWGLIVALLLFAGSLPLFIGLAVVLPWLGHATWHLYRKVVA